MKPTEKLSEAVERLDRAGYDRCFRADRDGLLEATGDPPLLVRPESMVVEEMVRCEGEGHPGDEAVLFALRSEDGRSRGRFVTGFGPGTSPANVSVMHALDVRSARDGRRNG